MVRETTLSVDNLIYPMFIVDGKGIKEEISSMPGNFRWSLDTLLPEIEECMKLGLNSFVLFPAIEEALKDSHASYSYDDNNSLSLIKHIGRAEFIINKWHLQEINETMINNSLITKKYTKEDYADFLIDKKLINIKTRKSASLSLADVSQNISYLTKNNLDPDIQKKIYWEKLFMPLSTVVMLFLSMPFIFGKHRSANLSKRLVLGVFIGIGFVI